MEKEPWGYYFASFLLFGTLVVSMCLYEGDFLGNGASLEKQIQEDLRTESPNADSLDKDTIYNSEYNLNKQLKIY